MMPLEIEAKLKVESLLPIQSRLRALKVECVGTQVQTDLYCDNAPKDMVTQDKCLRVRIQTSGKETRTFITYKGPPQASDVKCRQEIEWPVPNASQALVLIEGLGYEQRLAVHKCRELWSYKQCLICLDQVTDLGTFVEIEGPSSDVIREVQQDLELSQVRHCPESYACLLAENQKPKTENQKPL